MPQAKSSVPVKTGAEPPSSTTRHPFDSLRQQINHLFDDFDGGFFGFPSRRSLFASEPFWNRQLTWTASPAVDIAETDKAFEITAEMPGLDEKDVEVKVANGYLRISGEKQEEKEEKKKDYYLHERQFGSFERSFPLPDGVDTDKIAAEFKKGVLKVTLPKKPEAQTPEKKISIKPA